MVLWIITPADVMNMGAEAPAPRLAPIANQPPAVQRRPLTAWQKAEEAITGGTVMNRVQAHWDQTTAALVLKHFLYGSQSPGAYIASYLQNEGDAGFLRITPNAHWQRSLALFRLAAIATEEQARAAHVPLVATLIPNRGQAAMISAGEWPAGYDPYKLDNELRTIIESQGGTYIDILPDFRTLPDPEQHYYPVDGHPDPDGHAMIAGFLAKALTGGAVPTLTSVPTSFKSSGKGR
jgi:hypothetical protein